MLIEAARRIETAAKEALALVNAGDASCEEMRQMLEVFKAAIAIMTVAQTTAAASVAGRERHGDGGAEVLASGAGLSRQEARSQVKTAEALRSAPRLRDAVESGRVSVTNAKRLAEAAGKTSSADVEGDGDLLAKAESMRPEQFAKEARRWAVERQGDGGESEHARQRARRCVRVWDGDDGMVHLRGEFDVVTGRRIGNRLRAEAARMHDADKKDSGDSGERRSFDQCMADALDQLTAATPGGASGKPFADICVVAHVDEASGKLIAELPDDVRLPQSVLEELACNARFTGVIYHRRGRPIWRAHSVRRATKAQRQLLIARDGGCFACGAHPDICDAHHVRPVSQGGATSLDNMVLACWRCHNKIHHFGWQIHGPPGNRTLHPPDTATYGPAHAPEQLGPHKRHTQLRLVHSLVGHDNHHNPESTDAGAAITRPGPAAARATLRAAQQCAEPEPLFTPD
ncbi:MAG: DUF222 domain-containing protein [Acidimicrobiaceae bacterium]|nr:DUF222 domain-containing protein [Acidimicrobiaceae bacterium]MYJ82158.1 DUF222 domain-containing protein [Acidimicrobiaceae bacterium]MYK75074.1 DUF222 domain-containing protein [Acidimicrobiaceae bacterium]